jgi:hypothetical protein
LDKRLILLALPREAIQYIEFNGLQNFLGKSFPIVIQGVSGAPPKPKREKTSIRLQSWDDQSILGRIVHCPLKESYWVLQVFPTLQRDMGRSDRGSGFAPLERVSHLAENRRQGFAEEVAIAPRAKAAVPS